MRGINQVILLGTLGKIPETKTFPNGGSVTNFSIATSDAWIDKNTGQTVEQTEWHRIVLNNRLGEIAQKHLVKGSKVYIQGRIRTRSWSDQHGQTRYVTEIIGEQMQMVGSPSKQVQPPAVGYDQDSFNGFPQSTPDLSNLQTFNTAPKTKSVPKAKQPEPDLDDDLPF